MNNLLKKVKSVDVFTKHMEPILFEHGFWRCKKGHYVRMRGEILQAVYFYTYRPPAFVRFAAIPYWATEEKWLQEKDFDSFGGKEVSYYVDKKEGHDDYQRHLREPSYRRWDYYDSEKLNTVAALYAEKLPIYILPLLDGITDFDSWQNCADIYRFDHLIPIMEHQCVLDGNFNRFKDRLREIDEAEERSRKYQYDWIQNMVYNSTEDSIHLCKRELTHFQKEWGEDAHSTIREKLKLEALLNPCEETFQNYADVISREESAYHRGLLKKYVELIESKASTDVLKESLENRKIQMREAVKKHLKLEIPET